MAVTIARFLESLAAIECLGTEDLAAVTSRFASQDHEHDASELARDLVRQGKLTKFQAAAMYQGKADGLVLGNYLLLDKLGEGGMGQVFRARHRRMDRVVALKMLPRNQLDAPEKIDRFQREVKAAARLTHPNIVTAYDADVAGGVHFLVMEYIEGTNLSALVKSHGPLAPAQALDYVQQVACGLAYAHSQGVIHRDIKPGNLLVGKDGTVKILDMGLARVEADALGRPDAEAVADLTAANSFMGTVDYMAPEQALDCRHADARSDVYSLGCTLCWLLTGKPVYSGDTLMKRLRAHQQSAIPLLAQVVPGLPAELDQLFQKMVAKNPDERFQTVSEVRSALDQVVASCGEQLSAGARAATVTAAIPSVSAKSDSDIRHAASVKLPGRNDAQIPVRSSASKPMGKKKKSSPLASAVLIASLAISSMGGLALGYFVLVYTIGDFLHLLPKQTEQVAHAPTTPESAPTASVKNSDDVTAAPLPIPAVAPSAAQAAAVDHDPRQLPTTNPPMTAATADPAAAVAADAPKANEPASAPDVAPPTIVSTVPADTRAVPAPSDPSPTAANDKTEPLETKVTRLPVPEDAALAKAEALLNDIFASEIAEAKSDGARAALAEKLLDQAEQQKDDAAGYYAILGRARNLAIEAGEPAIVDKAINTAAEHFEIDRGAELAKALDQMVTKPHAAPVHKLVAEFAADHADAAQQVQQWELAKEFSDAALVAIRKTKEPGVLKRIVEQAKTIAAGKQQWDAYQEALATLKDKPDDPAANLVVGRYLSFVARDWPAGFEHLARSNDPVLKDLGAQSAASPQDAAACVSLGDAWWDAGEKAKGADKESFPAAAAYWYSLAVDELAGLAKTRVEKRMSELNASAPAATVSTTHTTKRTPPKAAEQRVAANGLSYPQVLDCTTRTYPANVNPTFNVNESWTLSLEFMPMKIDGERHMILHFGDSQPGHEPIYLRLSGDQLEAYTGDYIKKLSTRLTCAAPNVSAGKWTSVSLHYDKEADSCSLFVDGSLVAEQRMKTAPLVIPGMSVMVGGGHGGGQLFRGAVRNLWLGNQVSSKPDAPLPESRPAPKTAGAAGPKPVVAGGTTAGPRNAATIKGRPPKVANGLNITETIDCTEQVQLREIEPDFDLSKSWLFTLEFTATDVRTGKHYVFRKTSPEGGEPMIVVFTDGKLEVLLDARDTRDKPVFSVPIAAPSPQTWIVLVLRYNAERKEASLSIQGTPVGSQRCFIEVPPKDTRRVLFGGALKTATNNRYLGMVRNVWLGNDD